MLSETLTQAPPHVPPAAMLFNRGRETPLASREDVRDAGRGNRGRLAPQLNATEAAANRQQQLVFDLRLQLSASETQRLALKQHLDVLTAEAKTAAVQADARYVSLQRTLASVTCELIQSYKQTLEQVTSELSSAVEDVPASGECEQDAQQVRKGIRSSVKKAETSVRKWMSAAKEIMGSAAMSANSLWASKGRADSAESKLTIRGGDHSPRRPGVKKMAMDSERSSMIPRPVSRSRGILEGKMPLSLTAWKQMEGERRAAGGGASYQLLVSAGGLATPDRPPVAEAMTPESAASVVGSEKFAALPSARRGLFSTPPRPSTLLPNGLPTQQVLTPERPKLKRPPPRVNIFSEAVDVFDLPTPERPKYLVRKSEAIASSINDTEAALAWAMSLTASADDSTGARGLPPSPPRMVGPNTDNSKAKADGTWI